MLDGSKVFVVDGHVADTLIVVAKDAQAGPMATSRCSWCRATTPASASNAA
jgi:alkylation response protein AidB-like acyl-CoA dehydrogenase